VDCERVEGVFCMRIRNISDLKRERIFVFRLYLDVVRDAIKSLLENFAQCVCYCADSLRKRADLRLRNRRAILFEASQLPFDI
jgi:hypothetical protein